MTRLRVWWFRLLDLVLHRGRDARLSEELEAHIDLLIEEHIASGMSPADARLAARKAFGGVDQVAARYRDQRGLPWVDGFTQDVRFSVRLLSRNPLLTLTATLSLGIGIGADTATFTVANALLLQSPPGVVDPDRLVDITRLTSGERYGVHEISFPNFLDLRDRMTTLEDVYGFEPVAQPMSLADQGAERIFGQQVTPNYFAVLGVGASMGRLFVSAGQPATDRSSTASTVVLSHEFWARRFGKNPSVVGRTLRINGQPLAVVGVAAEGFRGTSPVSTDLWVPMEMTPSGTSFLWRRELGWALARGRLKPGVSVRQAAAEIDAIGRALEREYPIENQGHGFQTTAASLIPGNLAAPLSGVLALILVFVSLVLVIACANLAGLLLARATARRREMAVRVAIGAGRGRLVRQLLTETLVLFVLGAAAGLLLARVMASSLVLWLPALPVPLNVSLALDARVMAFAVGLSLVAALMCGLAPALQTSKTDVVGTLKDESMLPSGRSRLRGAFVVAQVALSILLVVGAGLFVRAIQRASVVKQGFNPQHVELASLDLSLGGYDVTTAPAFASALVDRVRELPGVLDATVAAILPTGGRLRFGQLSHPGLDVRNRQRLDADFNAVEPRYFSTLRIPLVAGRDFTAADGAGAEPVAIISEEGARRFWPGQDALGKILELDASAIVRGRDSTPRALRVVGVVGDVRSRSNDAPRPQMYLPLQQQVVTSMTLAVRTDGRRIANAIRSIVASLDPTLPILTAQTLEEAAWVGLLPQRVAASVSGALGGIGLLLAAIGVYGVTAYAVASRTREIGLRVALGAERVQVVAMILRQGMGLVALGSAIGLTLAAATARALAGTFFGFPALDSVAFLAATALVGVMGLVACVVPVWRAVRLDPAATLRHA